MNHLVAKVKDKCNSYRKIISDEEIYKDFETIDYVPYGPETLLEENQWFGIEEFSKAEYCLDILKAKWDSTAYKLIDEIDTDKIEYLCAYQNDENYCFQRIYKTSILKKKYVSLGDNIKLEQGKRILVINEEPDAIYSKTKDCLYFRKLETIAPIFKGIDVLYKEATAQEVEEFFNEPFINVDSAYTPNQVGKNNRKRLALAKETLATLSDAQKEEIFRYTNDYSPNLLFDGNRFTINNEEDLKNLLFGLEEKYYTTPVTHEARAANSVVPIQK